VWDALKSDLPGGVKRAFLECADTVLALDLFKTEEAAAIPPEVASLVDLRSKARAAKNFSESDRLRAAVESLGWLVEDTKDGQKARRK
jgi:cysteinyl-tRNA synthetase